MQSSPAVPSPHSILWAAVVPEASTADLEQSLRPCLNRLRKPQAPLLTSVEPVVIPLASRPAAALAHLLSPPILRRAFAPRLPLLPLGLRLTVTLAPRLFSLTLRRSLVTLVFLLFSQTLRPLATPAPLLKLRPLVTPAPLLRLRTLRRLVTPAPLLRLLRPRQLVTLAPLPKPRTLRSWLAVLAPCPSCPMLRPVVILDPFPSTRILRILRPSLVPVPSLFCRMLPMLPLLFVLAPSPSWRMLLRAFAPAVTLRPLPWPNSGSLSAWCLLPDPSKSLWVSPEIEYLDARADLCCPGT